MLLELRVPHALLRLRPVLQEDALLEPVPFPVDALGDERDHGSHHYQRVEQDVVDRVERRPRALPAVARDLLLRGLQVEPAEVVYHEPLGRVDRPVRLVGVEARGDLLQRSRVPREQPRFLTLKARPARP